jgi:hypothetical protein
MFPCQSEGFHFNLDLAYTAFVQRDDLVENYGMSQHRIFGEARFDHRPSYHA